MSKLTHAKRERFKLTTDRLAGVRVVNMPLSLKNNLIVQIRPPLVLLLLQFTVYL